ncbi:sensor histidine kinase [Sinomonas mesophila]|uniref:sensor histidine kinase n=1 Tax=Sinomonas mesophila TaxID=1531955 RepID=UPI0011157901|nr:ATP-binding protein [Sinomonas mesophila]
MSPRRRVILSQLPLTLATGLAAVIVAVWHPDMAAGPLFQIGLLFHGAMLALACAVPWQRLPAAAALAMPLLDFIPVGMVGVAGLGTVIQLGVLAVIPVVWLAWSGVLTRFCLAMTFLGPLAVVWLPVVAAGSREPAEYADVLMLPAMMLATGWVVHMLSTSARDQHESVAAARDDLQSALEALRREQRLRDAVLETVDVGVQAIDSEGRTVLANRQQLLNEARAGSVPGNQGREWPEVYGPEGEPLPPEAQPAVRALRGETFSDQVVRLGTGASQRVFSTSARPIPGPSPEGAVLAFTDVTGLVQALAVKDDFLSSVSHELRTPLTSVLGYVDMLLAAGDLPDHTREGLDIVRRNAERLQRLVADLLAAASGTGNLRPEPTDLGQLVREAVEAAAEEADAAGVWLKHRTEGPLPAVLDPVRISQVLDNLLSNALKYTPPGGRVTVRAYRADSGHVIEVADTGIGMGAGEAAGLFEKFYRTETARKSGIPGIGLGLSIAKAIATAHGGTIACTSSPGQGSTFAVHLPDRHPVPGHRTPPERERGTHAR